MCITIYPYLLGLGLGEVDAAVGAGGRVALGVGPAVPTELLRELLLHRGPRRDCLQLLQLLHDGVGYTINRIA